MGMERTRVLAVDDDPVVRRLVEIVLGADGFDVAVASNVNEAWDCVRRIGRPDLVLSGLEKPIDPVKLRETVRTVIARRRLFASGR